MIRAAFDFGMAPPYEPLRLEATLQTRGHPPDLLRAIMAKALGPNAEIVSPREAVQ